MKVISTEGFKDVHKSVSLSSDELERVTRYTMTQETACWNIYRKIDKQTWSLCSAQYFYLSAYLDQTILQRYKVYYFTFFPFSCFSTSLDLIAGLLGCKLGLKYSHDAP